MFHDGVNIKKPIDYKQDSTKVFANISGYTQHMLKMSF